MGAMGAIDAMSAMVTGDRRLQVNAVLNDKCQPFCLTGQHVRTHIMEWD